ncbi:MAG: haloacid dehalogenase type II [Acidobacteriota bacterium]
MSNPAPALLDFSTLTFDCYGTLIDWETGIEQALRQTMPGAPGDVELLLETFGRCEAEEEATSPTALYPEILARVHARLATAWGVESTPEQAAAFGASVGDWPAFEDSPAALQVLKRHFTLVILSNVDRESFARSQARLGVEFDHVFTAQDIGSYKPNPRNFHYAIERLAEGGVEQGRILHTAQSLYHDHMPASALGFKTCWIDRRHGREGTGATKAAPHAVDVDFRFEGLADFAAAVEAEAEARRTSAG